MYAWLTNAFFSPPLSGQFFTSHYNSKFLLLKMFMKLGSKLTFSPRVTPHIPGYADVQNSIRAFFKKSIMRESHVNHLQFIKYPTLEYYSSVKTSFPSENRIWVPFLSYTCSGISPTYRKINFH